MNLRPRFFKQKEFKCKCGKCSPTISKKIEPKKERENYVEINQPDTYWVEPELLQRLDMIRRCIGVPMQVSSGYRCEAYNKRVGGAKNSYHKRGMAADIPYPAKYLQRKKDFAKILDEAFSEGGVGVYPTFVHVDIRKRRARWVG